MKLFTNKIPLHITPAFWVLACIISWFAVGSPLQAPVQFAVWILIVFASVVVHELGHAFFATLWGQNVQIVLGPLGGTTMYGQGKKSLSRIKEFIVVAAGPIFGLLLAGLSSLMLRYSSPVFFYFLSCLTFANIIWSFFNLLPVHPFDGGKLMSIVLEGIFGGAGMKASYILSGIFAVLLAAYCIVTYRLFAGALLLLCAFESFKNFKERRYFQTTKSEKELEAVDHAETEDELKTLVQTSTDDTLVREAKVKLAKLYVSSGENEKAYQLLSFQKLSPEELKLKQFLAYKMGNYNEAIDAGNRLFRESQDPASAIINAFSSARLGDVTAAINWLSMVKKSKAVEMKALLHAQDFDSIRSDPRFKLLSDGAL